MAHARGHLGRVGQPHRGAHLVGDGLGQIRHALLDTGGNLVEQVGAVFHAGLREAREGALGGGHGLVHIGGRAHRDHGEILFGGRIFDFQRARRYRINPFAIDIEFEVLLHE